MVNRLPPPDRAALIDALGYEPKTGLFTWLSKTAIRVRVGSPAGVIRRDGYLQIGFHGQAYLAHRLALYISSGIWPEFVDHINGQRSDNRLTNLRIADASLNAQNRAGPNKNNPLQLLGVARNHKGFRAAITVNGVVLRLGTFRNPGEAHRVVSEVRTRVIARMAARRGQ